MIAKTLEIAWNKSVHSPLRAQPVVCTWICQQAKESPRLAAKLIIWRARRTEIDGRYQKEGKNGYTHRRCSVFGVSTRVQASSCPHSGTKYQLFPKSRSEVFHDVGMEGEQQQNHPHIENWLPQVFPSCLQILYHPLIKRDSFLCVSYSCVCCFRWPDDVARLVVCRFPPTYCNP